MKDGSNLIPGETPISYGIIKRYRNSSAIDLTSLDSNNNSK